MSFFSWHSPLTSQYSPCHEEKRETLFKYLREISFTEVIADEETIAIAEKFVDLGILRQKAFDDCCHIAAAIVNGCDAIVSWNFHHIVNPATVAGVKAVTALSGYSDLMIYTPTYFLGGDKNDT